MANKKKTLTRAQELERLLTTSYRTALWHRFAKACKSYELLSPGDKVCVCISGGKDSMVMALLFKHLHRYSDFPFDLKYVVMNPGYNKANLELIKENLKTLEIPAVIVDTDIFEIANSVSESPCYLCAKMRRGALYRIAKMWGCNKIALGHHYDDVIETTLMNMLNSGSFQTMLPKLPSTNYDGMEVIRPMYLIREKDVVDFQNSNGLHFLRCACRFTEEKDLNESGQRKKTKALIAWLKENYNPLVEKNIFKASANVQLDKLVGYFEGGVEHSFLSDYEENKQKQYQKIKESGAEEKAIEKAEKEHREFRIDDSLEKEFGE